MKSFHKGDTMNSFYVKLERDELSEDFVINAQVIDTSIPLTVECFKSIEYQVNKIAKDLEAFIMTVRLVGEEYWYFNGSYLKKQVRLELTTINDFDGNNLLKENVQIKF